MNGHIMTDQGSWRLRRNLLRSNTSSQQLLHFVHLGHLILLVTELHFPPILPNFEPFGRLTLIIEIPLAEGGVAVSPVSFQVISGSCPELTVLVVFGETLFL